MPSERNRKERMVVDLGSYSIKFITGRLSGHNIDIKSVYSIPVSQNIYSNGDISNIRELEDLIRNYVSQRGLKNNPVVFTFSSMNTITRLLDVPVVKQAEIKDMVEYEMQQYLPADISQHIIQYKLLPGQAIKEGTQRILASSIPRMIADNLWNIAHSCGMHPLALDIHTNALTKLMENAQAINENKNIHNATVALIEIGHTLMDVSIFEKGEFQFNRRLLMGGVNIDQRIERLIDKSTEDARMEKHGDHDISREIMDYTDENRVLNAVKSGVDEWISEIERVLRFYTTRKPGNRIDCCYVYGGGAAVTGIDKYMANALDTPTEVIRQIDGVIVDGKAGKFDLSLYVNAIGALIRKEEQK